MSLDNLDQETISQLEVILQRYLENTEDVCNHHKEYQHVQVNNALENHMKGVIDQFNKSNIPFRNHVASSALNALLISSGYSCGESEAAKISVKYTDALIAELEKTKQLD